MRNVYFRKNEKLPCAKAPEEPVDYGEPVLKIDKQEHEESHADMWYALGFSDEEAIMSLIETCVQEGSIPEGEVFEETKEYLAPIICPVGSPAKTCVLLVKRGENYEVESAYPLLEGFKNEVIIGEKYTWENKLEGDIQITNINGFENYISTTFFIQDFGNCEKDTKLEIYISGIAYSVEDAIMEFEVDKGPLYENSLKDFLKENPEKRKEDFQNPIVRMDGLVTLFPTETHTLYQYRGTILAIETVDFFGKKVYKAKICIKKTEEGEKMFIYLYISPNNCENCIIEIGKDIMGILKLQGYR